MQTKIVLVLMFMMQGCIAAQKEITVKVVDELGLPVEEATVSAFFDNVGSKNDVRKYTKTNSNGVSSLFGETPYSVPVRVEKEGYYTSSTVHRDVTKPSILHEIQIRRISNPVPMVAYIKRFEIPVLNKDIPFDLFVGDWVVPYGEGVVGDFYFEASRKGSVTGKFTFSLNMTFPNSGDGLIVVKRESLHATSQNKFLNSAPSLGYEPSFKFQSTWENGGKSDQLPFAVLRTRSKLENEVLVSAHYTKLYPEFEVVGAALEKPVLQFSAYFNPEINNRSLELDLHNNLYDEEYGPWVVTLP